VIHFITGTTTWCATSTNASGVARCSPPPLNVLTQSSYTARFFGDEDFAPSSGSNTITRVG
jgi:hypothetical protein